MVDARPDRAGIVQLVIPVVSHDGTPVTMSIRRTGARTGVGPAFFVVGPETGGWRGLPEVLGWLPRYNALAVTVDHRPGPSALEDCYAGICWLSDHLVELGVEPTQLIVVGAGPAAALARTTQDRWGPVVMGLMLPGPSGEAGPPATFVGRIGEDGPAWLAREFGLPTPQAARSMSRNSTMP